MIATVIETEELLKTALASLVAGVGVTVVFALAIFGMTRFADFSRDDRPLLAAGAAALAVACLLVVLAAVVVGVVVMTQK